MNWAARVVARNIELNQVLDILHYANDVCSKLKRDLPGLLAGIQTTADRVRVSRIIQDIYNDRLEDNEINYTKVNRHLENRTVRNMYNRYRSLLADIGQLWNDYYAMHPELQVQYVVNNNNRSNASSWNSRHRRRRGRKTRRRRN